MTARNDDIHNPANTLVGFADTRGTTPFGQNYPGAIPFADAENLLTFPVISVPVTIQVPDTDKNGRAITKTVPVTDPRGNARQAYYRPDTGTTLGIHGTGHTAHPYTDFLLRRVSNVLGDSLVIGGVSLLRGGAAAFVQIESPDEVNIGGEAFRPFISAFTSLDGTLATTYGYGSMRLMCANMISGLIREARKGANFKQKHTRHSLSNLNVENARQALEMINRETEIFATTVESLMAQKVTPTDWAAFLDVHVPLPAVKETKGGGPGRGYTMAESKREDLSRLFYRDERIGTATGTAWGVLQADNTWRLWESQVKGSVARHERNVGDLLGGRIESGDRLALANLDTAMAVA